MSSNNEHMSLPRLYGVPPHEPRRMAPMSERPPNPDDLPIERFRTPEEDALAVELAPRAYSAKVLATVPMRDTAADGSPQLRGRPVLLRMLAGRLARPRAD